MESKVDPAVDSIVASVLSRLSVNDPTWTLAKSSLDGTAVHRRRATRVNPAAITTDAAAPADRLLAETCAMRADTQSIIDPMGTFLRPAPKCADDNSLANVINHPNVPT
ncbi:hypothetical protein [Amycolatopsis coloradensis]|uniref:hypothetical protein n=1 Tax=Amycolatopsis coloradensis TaxID=76021 RepID=UPI001178818C|nr:hypothetical protein [Amycolatopsis coloradensis]